MMKRAKLLYRKKKNPEWRLFWVSVHKRKLTQTNKFAFDKNHSDSFCILHQTRFVSCVFIFTSSRLRHIRETTRAGTTRELVEVAPRLQLSTWFCRKSRQVSGKSLRGRRGSRLANTRCIQLPVLHFCNINIPLIIILKWKRILCWSANLMNYGSRLLLLIIKTYFINIQVCHASNNERFRGGYFPCAS